MTIPGMVSRSFDDTFNKENSMDRPPPPAQSKPEQGVNPSMVSPHHRIRGEVKSPNMAREGVNSLIKFIQTH
jgi:hypothetical protein